MTEHQLEFLSLKGGCICSSMSIHAKMPHCWNSYVSVLIPNQLKDSYKTDINVDDFITVDHRKLVVAVLISLRDFSGSS